MAFARRMRSEHHASHLRPLLREAAEDREEVVVGQPQVQPRLRKLLRRESLPEVKIASMRMCGPVPATPMIAVL
jgi:hypothetical protein